MNDDIAQQEFNAAQHSKSNTARALSQVEVASYAHEAGLNLHAALSALRKCTNSYYAGSREAVLETALESIITALTGPQTSVRVLELSADKRLLSAELITLGRGEFSVFVRDADFAEALRLLLVDTPTTVSVGMPIAPADGHFMAIICAPPIGTRVNGGDGFGSEVVSALAPALATDGLLCWITLRGVLVHHESHGIFSAMSERGLHVVAVVDLAPGLLTTTPVEGVLIVFRRKKMAKKLVGVLRGPDDASAIATSLRAGPVNKSGATWAWLPADDHRNFLNLEHERLIREMTPRGRYELRTFRSLLADERVERANRPLSDDLAAAVLLFVPEYAGSRVTADLEDQTVKTKSVYRFIIDTTQANPRFLAQLLNSPYGMQLRLSIAGGATIQRIDIRALLSLRLPIPDLKTQNSVARVHSDIGLLEADFRDMRAGLERNWTRLDEMVEKVDALKAVLDIEQRIAGWWRELPYPLATIYRRYQVSLDPRQRFETLLHFFEMFAVYLATIGTSHVKALRQDWGATLKEWLHPPKGSGIRRADFGFWIKLAEASLKDTARITSDKVLRSTAIEIGSHDLVQVASTLSGLGKATAVLDVARSSRNSWKGHGGYLKTSDAERLDRELQQQIRDLYKFTSSLLRSIHLVRPGSTKVTDAGLVYDIDLLVGSDPTFKARQVELDRLVKYDSLAFWGVNSRTMCPALPFFRLGAPQEPQETNIYVFNRETEEGFRWISYQEVREQEIVAPDSELRGIIDLGQSGE